MRTLIILTIFLTTLSEGWVSGGDQTIQSVLDANQVLVTRSASAPEPIRIFFDVSSLPSGDLKSAIQEHLPAVRAYFSKTLKVHSVVGKWQTNEVSCGGEILPDAIYSYSDVWIVVKHLPGPGPTGVSYACQVQNTAPFSVIGGMIKIHDSFKDESKCDQLNFLLHLTFHVLGFSDALAHYWFDGNNKFNYANVVQNLNVRGVNKKIIVSPNVKEKARAAFNYPGLSGVELEEENPLRFNWEARVMHNDLMTSRKADETIISDISLALLLDTGWYQVDFTMGQTPFFGRGAGSAFVENKCIVDEIVQNNELWCDSPGAQTCDFLHLNKGTCNIQSGNNIANSAFQYFSDLTKGGSDFYSDYCPYVQRDPNGNCRDWTISPGLSEIFGLTSRCFEYSIPAIPGTAACWEVTCYSDYASFSFHENNDKITLDCPASGGLLNILQYGGGTVECPSFQELCGEKPCPCGCSGFGSCVNGFCQCFDGHSGILCDISCESNCVTCSSVNECTLCKPGFYLQGGDCKACKTGCKTCTSDYLCSACFSNYVPSFTSLGVVCSPKCQVGCSECDEVGGCTTPDVGYCFNSDVIVAKCCEGCLRCPKYRCCECLECNSGYFLTSIGTCTKDCAVNCLICANIYECAVCKPGYLLDDDYKCIKCPTGCKTCHDECPTRCTSEGPICDQDNCYDNCPECSKTICDICNPGYSMINNICVRDCPQNCRTCVAGSGICQMCNSGFFLDSDSSLCKACEAGCLRCSPIDSTKTSCEQCTVGYYLGARDDPSDGDCINCMSGCYICDGPKTCRACYQRWWLDFNGNENCIRCDYGCKQCYDAFECIVPECGYYVMVNGKVNKCNKSCATCDTDQICNTCIYGYFFYECSSTNCLCRYCEPNCAKCSGPVECIACKVGFYLEGQNSCFSCDPLCYSCDRPGQCSCCRGGYFLDENKQCLKCSTGCLSCTSADHCKCCAAGWWPDEYVCKTCPYKCALCWSLTECYSCVCGFWLDKCSSCLETPPSCKPCPEPCLKCNSPIDCLVCRSGYFVNLGICSKCGDNCANCLDETHCNICFLGFYILEDRTCAPCAPGCADCCDYNTCLKSKAGYYLLTVSGPEPGNDQIIATKCADKCLLCTSSTSCTSCTAGYYSNSGICTKCPETCTACSAADKCSRCVAKSYLNEGSCIPCDSNCNVCDIGGCITARSGFYVGIDENSRRVPVVCKDTCLTCVGEGSGFFCISCKVGYGTVSSLDPEVKTFKCDACDTGCYSCTTQNFCTRAKTGYYLLNDGTVQLCPNTCTSCKWDTGSNSVICLTCKTYYGLNAGRCDYCGSYCAKCSNGKCDTCFTSYFYNAISNACERCASPCYLCSGSSTNCISCISGYLLSSNSCQKCNSPCSQCSGSVTTCTACPSGYYLSGGACLPCRTSERPYCATCKLVESVVTCLTCLSSKVPPACI